MSSPDKPLEDQVSILIVDDLPSQHVVLRTVLEAPGHDVIAVNKQDGHYAFAIRRARPAEAPGGGDSGPA